MMVPSAGRRPQRRRCSHLPEDVGRFGAAGQDHRPAGGGGQGRGHLENEYGVRVAPGVEREIA